jgi:mRNA-degrading endonuclease RelE of RelBE toxin-antitoxin system
MPWEVVLARQAARKLADLPPKDHARLVDALAQMEHHPYTGDVVKLKGMDSTFRRRVGSYRVFFEVHDLRVSVVAIERRTSTTY